MRITRRNTASMHSAHWHLFLLPVRFRPCHTLHRPYLRPYIQLMETHTPFASQHSHSPQHAVWMQGKVTQVSSKTHDQEQVVNCSWLAKERKCTWCTCTSRTPGYELPCGRRAFVKSESAEMEARGIASPTSPARRPSSDVVPAASEGVRDCILAVSRPASESQSRNASHLHASNSQQQQSSHSFSTEY